MSSNLALSAARVAAGLVLVAGIVVVGLYASVFTVGQMQQALVLQLGRVRAVLNPPGETKPGLYFKADDLKVPEKFRGIGVRIEDDIVITQDGNENLSAAMPRSSADVEAWIAEVREENA